MHIQKPQINQINELAHRAGKITVMAATSVSGCPEYYPEFDILHLGELGDASDRTIEYLNQNLEIVFNLLIINYFSDKVY